MEDAAESLGINQNPHGFVHKLVDLTPIYGHFNREIMMTHHWILDRPRGGFSSWLAARNRKVPNFRRGHTDPKYPTLRFHIQSDRKNETLRFPFGGLNLCWYKETNTFTGNHFFYHQTLRLSIVFSFQVLRFNKKPKRRGSHAADHDLLSHTRKNQPPSSEGRGYMHRSHSNAWGRRLVVIKYVGKHQNRWLLWAVISQKLTHPSTWKTRDQWNFSLSQVPHDKTSSLLFKINSGAKPNSLKASAFLPKKVP